MSTFSIANHDHSTFYPLTKFIASAQVWGTDTGVPARLGVAMKLRCEWLASHCSPWHLFLSQRGICGGWRGYAYCPSHPESRCTYSIPLSVQNVCKAVEETQHPPTLQEIKQKIDSYNSREKHCLGMKLVSRALSTRTRHPSCPTPTSLSGCRVLAYA